MSNKQDILKARVAARNKCHAEAMKLYDLLAPIFEPLVGTQIVKIDGTLLAKVNKLMPELPCEPSLHIFRYSSDYTLSWTVKVSEMIGDTHTCVYEDITINIGEFGSIHPTPEMVAPRQTLVKLSPRPELCVTFTAEEIKRRRKLYAQKKKEADDAHSALYPFGEYDH